MNRPEPKDAVVPSKEDLDSILELLEDERLNDDWYTGVNLDNINVDRLLGAEG